MVSTKITHEHQMQLPIVLEVWSYPGSTRVFLANTEGQGRWLDCEDLADAQAKLEQTKAILARAEHELQEMGWDLS